MAKKYDFPKLSAAQVAAGLKARYRAPQWATFMEVHDSTGAGMSRSVDLLACSLWPSDNFVVHGFEIKISRGDFQRELKTPQKAEAIARYCDTWSVACPEGMVDREELPAGWGLFEVGADGKWRWSVSPANRVPVPWPLSFRASVLRRAHEAATSTSELVAERGAAFLEAKREVERAFADRVERADRRAEDADERYDRLDRAHREFQEATGISVHVFGRMSSAQIATVKAALGGRIMDAADPVWRAVQQTEEALRQLQKAQAALAAIADISGGEGNG